MVANFGGSDFQYNVNINYPMDYLFGGSIALISRIAAKTAAANSSIVVFDSTRDQLNLLQAAGLPLPSGRKKRLVTFPCIGSFVMRLIMAGLIFKVSNDVKHWQQR